MCVCDRLMMIRGRTVRSSATEDAMIRRYYHPSLEKKLYGKKNLRFSSSLTVCYFSVFLSLLS